MMTSLTPLLLDAASDGYAVPCFNVFGIEDAQAIIAAGEAMAAPVILACNREFVAFVGCERLATLLRSFAADATVPVCVHLDHCDDTDDVRRAVDAGFLSVMFDGSQLSLEDNIRQTRTVVEHAHAAGVSVEAEIGSVPYRAGSIGREHVADRLTTVEEAERFSAESGADAMAVAVGNCHRLLDAEATIDHARFRDIAARVDTPLVLHGASGIGEDDQRQLIASGARKFNIGTSIRKVLAGGLRRVLTEQVGLNDRLRLFATVMPEVQAQAAHHIKTLGAADRAEPASFTASREMA